MIKYFTKFYLRLIGILNFSLKTTVLVFSFYSCQDNLNDTKVSKPKLIVEGWIEENGVANVILSKSIPTNTNFNQNNIDKYFIRAAKVTVSDGVNAEILHLKMVNGYIPPFIYTGENIIGKKGFTYTLTIEFDGQELRAETSIPESVPIKELSIEKIDDFKRKIGIEFIDPDNKNYYQIGTRIVGKDSLFIPTLYGTIDDETFITKKVKLNLLKGIQFYPVENTETYFPSGKIIEVKLRTLEKKSYEFWNSWQNDVLNGQNPLFPATFNLKSNIKGGLGIWAGYGADVKIIKIK
ncbi:DUF4249 domain-containing protein [Flavobacterium columnare]|nr:DUF4249 domain-containing protein [Flavobacterium columnare]MEB3801395.1 DUF4249 domain-containing protein [Flavobacterium columnare]QOG57509.1 DUF4249 domain-containing protein [Flavobacterium columnare]QOG60233.1 DUF4249 domain-containing protein [Flavobacterium columnare]QOG62953.1 DUF4249 domain-containing protein [Flavobacterium columnare]QOG65676.1 DUF4249 domain-containing protein [Flavobacterium columnare]